MPFGSSISCAHFQKISNALVHIQKVKLKGNKPINYLDDFLFVAIRKMLCDQQVQLFMNICNTIRIPVSLEKTEWGSLILVFLGLLINTIENTVSIPCEKVSRAKLQINMILKCRKVKMHQLQKNLQDFSISCVKASFRGKLSLADYMHLCMNSNPIIIFESAMRCGSILKPG